MTDDDLKRESDAYILEQIEEAVLQARTLLIDAARWRFIEEYCAMTKPGHLPGGHEMVIHWHWQQTLPSESDFTVTDAIDQDIRQVRDQALAAGGPDPFPEYADPPGADHE